MKEITVESHTTISIIDDDDAVRMATASLVRSLGFQTTIFASAEEFLQSQQVQTSACIITDIQMPGMNGVEMQSALRAAGNNIPMIFMTAFPEDNIRRQAFEAGAAGFLIKPFEGDQILACLDKAIGAGSRGAENHTLPGSD
ncbi:two-component system response regulator [Rhizobium oryziradicis]|uniref:Two-component system response regulator n=1 Tax=Rhizobium oryziradicis TaxID=1867956 RepID=A0A1Q8ZXC9_9HYPH|nr:two-component system response regulator [Rhizobium oryziradicis]